MTSQVTSQTKFTSIPYPDWLKTYLPISNKVEEQPKPDFEERDFQARYAANKLFGRGPENSADHLQGQGLEKYKITQCTAPTANSPAIIVIERTEPKKTAAKRPRKAKQETTTEPKKPKKQTTTKKEQEPAKKKPRKKTVKIAAGSVLADN